MCRVACAGVMLANTWNFWGQAQDKLIQLRGWVDGRIAKKGM